MIVYVQKVEKEKLRYHKEYWKKKAKTRSESGKQKGGSCRQKFPKLKGHAPSSTSAPMPRNRDEYNG